MIFGRTGYASKWQCLLPKERKFPRRIFLLLKLEAFSINLLKRLSYPIMEASGDLHLHHKMDEPSAMVERGGGSNGGRETRVTVQPKCSFQLFCKVFPFPNVRENGKFCFLYK